MRLTVETGPDAGTVVSLTRDAPTRIGSADDCELRIRQAGVEPLHAVVKALKGTGFGIKANARVRVNGSEVQASPLHDGDVIEIGATRIAYGELQQRGLPNIPGYRVLDVLGKGGMGTVYRAEQVSLSREVALKVLNHEQTQDAMFVGKFVAEAQAAAKLHHPNVVSVFDVEHDGDTYYYAMELMHDGSCEDWLKQNGTMPVERALQVVADAAHGLAYAESLGIVHRDIKPDNLMLDRHGAVKIADLGLASTSADPREQQAIGTPHFMAPEQVRRGDLDHRTDLYALGCTFYRLVTGRTPFRGQTVKDILRAQLKEEATPANKANPEVPQEVAQIIAQLMAKEPRDRYQTANELLEDLEQLLRPPQKRGLWIGLAAAGVLLAGGAVWWAATRPDKIVEKTVREVYDDPEKQQFADRIVVLEQDLQLKNARIALLEAQLDAGSDEELAERLDRVRADHDGTPAAQRAAQLATELRARLTAERNRRQALQTRADEFVTRLEGLTRTPLEQHDYARAIAVLEAEVPAELQEIEDLAPRLAAVREAVLQQARDRLEALGTPVTDAIAAADADALQQSLAALAEGLQPGARWPAAVGPELTRAGEVAVAGKDALLALQRARRTEIWQSYHALLAANDGVDAQLAQRAFAAGATQLRGFAESTPVAEAADRARALAEICDRAEQFAAALQSACAKNELEFALGEEQYVVKAWRRDSQQLEVEHRVGRRNKDETLPVTALGTAAWQTLADQLPAAANDAGARECFLGLSALHAHANAARSYLQRLRADDDETGVGDQGFPFSSVVFDELLGRLPLEEAPWLVTLRDELVAGQHLSAGLRAMTERRNLAAAGHIDRLLDAHPHSVVVALLP